MWCCYGDYPERACSVLCIGSRTMEGEVMAFLEAGAEVYIGNRAKAGLKMVGLWI